MSGLEKVSDATDTIQVTAPPPEPTKPTAEKIKLGAKHKEHRAWMEGKGYGSWDEKAGGLNTHTVNLAEMIEHFDLPGDFDPQATGKDAPKDRNCILFPLKRGLWLCVRYGTGVEGKGWKVNDKGHAYCVVGKAKAKAENDPADLIVTEALQTDKFFHWQAQAYVEVTRKSKTEYLSVFSDAYARLLRVRHRKAHGQVVKGEWLRNATETIGAIATEEYEEIPVFVRLAYWGGKLYVDLADRSGNVVEIDGDGYRVIQNPPVRFLRTEKMLALPLPQPGGNLDELKRFVNVTDEDFPLLVGGILGCYHPTGPYPIIHIIGGDGHAKTSTALFILLLLDPSIIRGCAPPESTEDLILSVQTRWIYFIDNLSEIKPWLSDSLCRLSTGGAIERRKKYKDAETSAFVAKRPALLTSITDVVQKSDLGSRALKLDTPRIENYKAETVLMEDFTEARPRILGALYSALSSAIRNLPTTKVNKLTRLADFLLWCKAAEPATGLPADSIVNAYFDMRQATVDDVLDSDVARRIIAFATPTEWRGTGKKLAEALHLPFTSDREVKDFVSEVRTLQTGLESVGVVVAFKRAHGKRLITIHKA